MNLYHSKYSNSFYRISNEVESVIKTSIYFTNSEENFSKVKTILKLLQVSNQVDEHDDKTHHSLNINMTWYTEQFDKNMNWNKKKLKEIENWLDDNLSK